MEKKMSDAELLKHASALLEQLTIRKRDALTVDEARGYSVCFTHAEDATIRLRSMLVGPTALPDVVYTDQRVGTAS